MINWLVVHLIPPKILPKLDFRDGIPPEYSTIVVIPTLITDSDELSSLLRQLENHYLANPDPQLNFALLTDFVDAPQKEMPHEEKLLNQAVRGIQRLNRQYKTRTPFFLFHRERIWNAGEDCWMGWERKRGKLMEFNHLLKGQQETAFAIQVGNLRQLAGVRYVITLTRIPFSLVSV